MKIRQISVFLENRKSRLFDLCELLGKSSINIRALNVAETESFGVLRIVVDKTDAALSALKSAGFVANITDIVAVEVPDRPGGLADILKIFAAEDVNVEYMYGFVEKATDKALMVFRFDNPDRAAELLQKHDIRIANQQDIGNL